MLWPSVIDSHIDLVMVAEGTVLLRVWQFAEVMITISDTFVMGWVSHCLFPIYGTLGQ